MEVNFDRGGKKKCRGIEKSHRQETQPGRIKKKVFSAVRDVLAVPGSERLHYCRMDGQACFCFGYWETSKNDYEFCAVRVFACFKQGEISL